MKCWSAYVYHRRHDIFPSYPANEEICRPLEERLYLFWGFPLEELRAGGYQRIDKPCAVFPRPASSLLDTALNEVVIASLRLDDMEVVFTPACALGDTMKNLDFSDRVKNIKCPTLILCGKKDSANMKSADYLSQSIRSAELKIIENTGHVVNEENPKALADILNEYYLKNS